MSKSIKGIHKEPHPRRRCVPKDTTPILFAFGALYCFAVIFGLHLSVKQSKNNKSAIADVPEVIGSMFSTGFFFLAGGIGAILGVGGTIGTQVLMKRKHIR